jgi:hypothetical protein
MVDVFPLFVNVRKEESRLSAVRPEGTVEYIHLLFQN